MLETNKHPRGFCNIGWGKWGRITDEKGLFIQTQSIIVSLKALVSVKCLNTFVHDCGSWLFFVKYFMGWTTHASYSSFLMRLNEIESKLIMRQVSWCDLEFTVVTLTSELSCWDQAISLVLVHVMSDNAFVTSCCLQVCQGYHLHLGWLVVHCMQLHQPHKNLPHIQVSLIGLKMCLMSGFFSLWQLEKLDTDLKNYKSNSIKESIR